MNNNPSQMRATKVIPKQQLISYISDSLLISLIILSVIFAAPVQATQLKVMKMGLGSGSINSNPAGINCGGDCDESFGNAASVTLTATAAAGSVFVRWDGDGAGTANPITLTMDVDRSVRAVFDLSPAIPPLTDFTPNGIQTYLNANPVVNTSARFLKALPVEFKRSWILMSRSESLQTGIAESPRVLLQNLDAKSVFSIGMVTHSAYPGSHPNAVEYMQWDPVEKNFRFHEVVLDAIPPMGNVPARTRGVSVDDSKCFKCHSTRNVLNRSSFPGTTGTPPGTVKAKNKPNWDSYDSWGGMLPFNRDRIYQGSVEAAAFRQLFNPWTWRANDSVRAIIEQLELQPPGVPPGDAITRQNGGANDGHIDFAFDATPPVSTEPVPSGPNTITTAYAFDGQAGTGTATSVTRGGAFVTLHHAGTPLNEEGRGVQLFDLLGGADGNLNPQRIADELINHRFATGSVPIDVRPIALAIAKNVITIDTMHHIVSSPALTVNFAFFDARNGMPIGDLLTDTQLRAQSLPRRKADIQKRNLDRTGDVYLMASAGPVNGLVQQYGGATSFGPDTSLSRIRQEVFRRPVDGFPGDSTVMSGIYVDREDYNFNTKKIALFRYFLEPLGVSVDKWSMGVRGRSRAYTFADVFGVYINELVGELTQSLINDPVPGLSDLTNDGQLIAAVNSTLASLPSADAVPTFTDVQRIFNKSCVECHGGLGYPPYKNYGDFLDFSEDENPPASTPPMVSPRLSRSYDAATTYTTTDPVTSTLYRRITRTTEDCPFGLMPCGGPALSKADIETIRRWIVGPPSRPSTAGDPHLRTVEGTNYDFQSAGEFVLLRDEYLEIQARQAPVETAHPVGPNDHTGLTSCVSINTAVAIRIGRDRITYQPNSNGRPDPKGLQLRVNGKLVNLDPQGIPLNSGARIIQTSAPGGIQVEAPGGSVIVVTPGWWDAYQLWYLNIDARNIRATEGLMGSIAPGNWLPALPDGTLLGPKPADLGRRFQDLYERFGNAWRVNDSTSLFDYAAGTSTARFLIANWPGAQSNQTCTLPPSSVPTPTKPPLKGLSLAEATELTAGILDKDRKVNCIKDLMATGDKGFAKTYLLADKIAHNAYPTAPVLVFPEDFKTNLGTTVTFSWNHSTDADGDSITYRHYVWPVNDRPNNNNAVPVDTTTPTSGKRPSCVFLVVILGCLLLLASVLIATKTRPRPLIAVVIAILALGIIFAYYFKNCCQTDVATTTTVLTKKIFNLKPGKAYFWKVIAEDGNGGTVESETRRFEVK